MFFSSTSTKLAEVNDVPVDVRPALPGNPEERSNKLPYRIPYILGV